MSGKLVLNEPFPVLASKFIKNGKIDFSVTPQRFAIRLDPSRLRREVISIAKIPFSSLIPLTDGPR